MLAWGMSNERWGPGDVPSSLPGHPPLLRWDKADTSVTSALHEVHRAAHRADEPAEPPPSRGTFGSMLDGEWEGAPGEAWYLPGASDVPAAYYKLELPDLENLDRAPVYLYVQIGRTHV